MDERNDEVEPSDGTQKRDGATAPRTTTLPEWELGAFYTGDPDDVTALCEYLTGRMFVLPSENMTLSLGSGAKCDVSIEGYYLSKLHCTLERRSGALRVQDHGSHNGTYYGGRREAVFEIRPIRPGETFQCSSLRFVVLNEAMRAAYPVLTEIVGTKDEHGIAAPTCLPATSWSPRRRGRISC